MRSLRRNTGRRYGGGTVMVWDYGTTNQRTPTTLRGLRKGELKFSLDGQKLRESWCWFAPETASGYYEHRDYYTRKKK